MIPQIKEINFPEYATLHQATVTLQEMGDRTITTQVRIDGDVVPSFDGWELEFKGERFVLSIKDPQAAKDNTTKNSLVDLTFHSWAALQLKRYFFMEMTSVSTGTAIANSYNASLKLSLGDFIEAFDRVLDYYFGGKISIQLYPQSVYSSETSIFEINNTYIWDVLTKIYEVYHVRWFIGQDGLGNYIIKVDYPAEEIDDHDFEYGYKGGLLRFERHVQEEDITNILLGRGGTKNLPYRYFKEVDFFNDTFPADPDAIPELANIYFDRLRDANFRSYVQGWKAKTEGGYDESRATTDWAYRLGYSDTKFRPTEYVKDDESIAKYGEHWGALDDNDDIYPTIQGVSVDPYGRIDEVIDVSPIITDDIDAMAENAAIWYNVEGLHTITDTVPAGESREFVIRGGSFSVPSEAGKNLRGNLNWTYFSNFRTETDPEALSSAVYVDPTRSYITVEGTGEGGSDSASIAGLLPGTYSYEIHLFVVNDSGSDATGTFGVNELKLTVADRDLGLWQPTFDIWVKNIWGSQRLENETDEEYSYRVWRPILGDQFQNKAAVAFSSGWLSISDDYQFYIASYPVPDQTKEYNNVRSEWRITLRKSDAEYQATGLYIPNASTGGRAVPGDYFYFLGVDMPFQYVEWAEERLRDYKLANLGNLSEINPTWVINIDKVRVNTLEEEDYETTLADRLIAGGRIRTKDKRFTNGNILTLYVQSITYTWNEPTENNPYIVPDIEVILTDKPVAVEGAIDKVQGEVNVLQTQFANLADLESSIKKVGGMMFLKKTGESDRSYSPTKFNSSVNSGDFRQGDVGGRGWGIYNDGAGSSVYEVDKLIVRKEMFVNSLVVNQIEYVGGKQITSAASIHCTGVFEDDQAYECHFDQKHGTVKNLFKVGDIAMGQVFSADNLELKYYRRKVIEVGVDYIRLAKFNPDPIPTKVIGVDEETGEEIVEPLLEVDGSGIPSEGDVIIQYGSLTDPNRRFVIIRDVIGGGYDRMLSDLDHAGAAGKEYSFTGRQSGQNPRWFIGDKDAKQFAEYKDGILTISGIFNVVGDQGQSTPINQYLDDINTQFQVIQTQIDGAIETWFASGVPTLENFPAVNWPLDTDKNIHLGDLYYNQETGKAYRFQLENGVYVWREITDTDIQSALDAANAARQAAGNAQADADAAKARLDSWASDGVISPTEKQSIKDEIARVDSDYNMINRSYTLYKLGTPTAYNTAYAAYREQLVALSQDSPENIAIPATFATNQGTYYTERTSCLNRINQAILDGIEELSREIAGYEYLKEALKGSTTIQGGLILSSTIQLGKTENDAFKVYSGINGIPVDGKLGGGIAAWFGGDMIDHEEEPEKIGYAKTIFRHDGSGYLASGNISWGPTGAGQIPGISWTADGKVILSNDVYLEGGTEQIISLINAVNKFASFFEEDANGNIRTRNNRGLYSMSFVSAGGVSGTSGGGTGGNVARSWNDVVLSDPTQSLGSNLGADLKDRIEQIESGSTDVSINLIQLSGVKIATITVDGADYDLYAPSQISSLPLSSLTGADDLQAIEALTGTNGFLKKTAANTWTLDNTSYATASDLSTLSGKVTTLQGYFTDGSAKSAKQLANTVVLWGNNFNGTQNLDGGLVVKNNSGLYIKDSAGNAKSIVELSSADVLHIGYGARASYATLLYGQTISFLANSVATVVVSTNVLRRSDSSPAATLGNSTYKWANLYSLAGEFTNSVKIGNATISWDSTTGALKIDQPMYSESWISAGGVSSDSGQEIVNAIRSWADYVASDTTQVLGANLGVELKTDVDALKSAGYATVNYVDSQLANLDLSGQYLPLSGGAMTNTNLVTNLNADLLDGKHATEFPYRYTYSLGAQSAVNIVFNNRYDAIVAVSYGRNIANVVLVGSGYGNTDIRNKFTQISRGAQSSAHWRYHSGQGVQIINDSSIGVAIISVTLLMGSTAPTFTPVDYDTTSAYNDDPVLTVSGASAKYLPLTGGTLTGRLYLNHTELRAGAMFYINDGTSAIAAMLHTGSGIRFGNGSVATVIAGSGDLTHLKGATSYKIWDESNDGADSGLDADLLDGQQGTYYAKATDVTTLQGYFTNGSANSAIKLATARKLWSQDFDGTGDVTGGMSNVGNITPMSTDSYNLGGSTLYWNSLYVKGGNVKSGFVYGNGRNDVYIGSAAGDLGSSYTGGLMFAYGDNPLYFYTNSLQRAVVTGSGNVGIGTGQSTNPAEKLTVAGNIAPSVTNTYNLGTASLIWNNLYVNNIKIGSATISWDATNNALKVDTPLYSTSWITAGGVNSQDGGGSNVNVLRAWDSSEYAPTDETQVLGSNLGWDLNTRVSALQNAGYITANEVDSKLAHLDLSGSYLPLSGGTLTGNLTFDDGTWAEKSVLFKTNRKKESGAMWAYAPIRFVDRENNPFFFVGAYGNKDSLSFGYIGVNSYNGVNLRFYPDNTIKFGNNLIWHAGNSNLDTIDWTAKTLTLAVERSDWNFGVTDKKIRLLECGRTTATGAPGAYFSGLSAIARTGFQLVTYEGSSYPNLRYRKLADNGTWSDWYTLAFTSDNVASANKLYTPRRIWGHSFDGTADVSGSISNAIAIEFNGGSSTSGHGGLIDFHYNGSADDYTSRIIESDNGLLNINYAIYANLSGNVGIGTSSPSEKLEVNGKIKSTSFVTSGGTSSQFVKGDGSLDSTAYATAASVTTLQGYFDSSGNAKTALKLASSVDLWGQGFDGSDEVNGMITIYNGLKIGKATDVIGSTVGYGGAISTIGSNPLYLGTNGDRNMVITSAGNVGIGTNSPSDKLHVNGNIKAAGTLTGVTSISMNGAISGATNISMSGTLSGATGISMNGAISGVTNLNSLVYLGSNAVGIGVSNPAYSLDVSGSARYTGSLYVAQKIYLDTGGNYYIELRNVGTSSSPVWALYTNAPIVSSSFISAGGVSSTSN